MIRKVIHIDREKCNGCGACANACHEGAIGMVNGKATLLRDDYCDGFGDCLPTCPTGAITFEEREAAPYDRQAVEQRKAAAKQPMHHGCPGNALHQFHREVTSPVSEIPMPPADFRPEADPIPMPPTPISQLAQWPCQIKLVPERAPFFENAKLLIAADCTAYAYARMHEDFMRGRVTLIGCPKLDEGDYAVKLGAILRENEIKSVTVVRMEVPCCGGLENAAKRALQQSGRFLPWRVVTISLDGRILDD